MPGLDVLRGCAVLSVVCYHEIYWRPWYTAPEHSAWSSISAFCRFGWLGVFLFFVLSGFLITGILLDSKPRPDYWRSFYLRRALRILPALLLTLLVCKLAIHATWLYLLACLAYLANLTDMLGISGPGYGVLWSLAVEEQFYLGWPWLVKLLNRRALACVAVGSIVLSPLLRYLSAANILPLGDPHTMTWLISDNLATGACLALLLRSEWGEPRRVRRIAWGLFSAGAAILLLGTPFHILHREQNPLGAAFQTVPFELIFAAWILWSLFWPASPRPLWMKALAFFGYISYGLYLYHEMAFRLMDHQMRRWGFMREWSATAWLARLICEGGITVLIAYLSRRYFEAFFLSMKSSLLKSR